TGKFIWNNGTSLTSLAQWQTALGGCPGTDNDCNSSGPGSVSPHASCAPTFAAVGSGDLHLAPGDTCAKGKGIDLSSIAPMDIDGESWAPGPFNVGADATPSGATTTMTSTTTSTTSATTSSTSTTTTSSTTPTTIVAGSVIN